MKLRVNKIYFIIVVFVSVGIAYGLINTLTSDEWFLKIDTQCNNPWDGNIKKHFEPFYDQKLNRTERLKLLEVVIVDHYEMKNIDILEIYTKKNLETPDICEGCDCNSGGHGFYVRVDDSDKEFMLSDGWKLTTAPEIKESLVKEEIVIYTEKTEYEIGEPIRITMKNESNEIISTSSIPIGFSIIDENGNLVCSWIGGYTAIGSFKPQDFVIETWEQKYCEEHTQIESGSQVSSGTYTIIGNHFSDYSKPIPRLDIRIVE